MYRGGAWGPYLPTRLGGMLCPAKTAEDFRMECFKLRLNNIRWDVDTLDTCSSRGRERLQETA